MSANEVIHESPTGGRKAGNLERFDQLPPAQLRELAAFNTTPYASHWMGEGGSFNELNAQLWKFWEGDDVDPETGYNRMVHVAFHAMELLMDALSERGQYDDSDQLSGQADTFLLFDLFDAEVLRLLALHYGRGAVKYGDSNYQLGYNWDLSFAALNRHLWQHQSGQFLDEETGSPHLVAVVWHAITLLWFYENKPEFDTRTSTKQQLQSRDVEAELRAELKDTTLALQEFVLSQQDPPTDLLTGLEWDNPFEPWVQAFKDLGAQIKEGWEALFPPEQPEGPVLYISGPMTGMPDHNFPAFHQAAEFYRELGYTVINPAELPGEGGDHPWEWFLRRDLVAMLEGGADTIVMLPGWETSRGANLEKYVADKLGFNVRYFVAPELDTQRDLSWTDAINDIVVDLDDQEGNA